LIKEYQLTTIKLSRRMNAKTDNFGTKRKIGHLTATSIVVANMIGAGIFTTSGIMAVQLPNHAWVLGCWIFGGLVTIAGALCYAELATRMPEVGGEYIYHNRLYHPLLGFLTGWTSFFVGFSAPIAASAMGIAEHLSISVNLPISNIPLTMIILKKSVAGFIILGPRVYYAMARGRLFFPYASQIHPTFAVPA